MPSDSERRLERRIMAEQRRLAERVDHLEEVIEDALERTPKGPTPDLIKAVGELQKEEVER